LTVYSLGALTFGHFDSQTRLDDLEESVRRVGPTFVNMRTRLEAREDAEFLKAKLALADPSNRVRSDLAGTRRENNVTQVCVICTCVYLCGNMYEYIHTYIYNYMYVCTEYV